MRRIDDANEVIAIWSENDNCRCGFPYGPGGSQYQDTRRCPVHRNWPLAWAEFILVIVVTLSCVTSVLIMLWVLLAAGG